MKENIFLSAIKVKRERKCLSCCTKKAKLDWYKLTPDGVFVMNYICECGKETVFYKNVRIV